MGKPWAGAIVHRVSVANLLDKRFDGDTASGNIAYSDEAIAETIEMLKSPQNYIGPDGRYINSVGTSTVDLVMFNMTGDPQ